MQLKELTFQEFEERAAQAGVELPIEQTKVWADFEATIPGRSHWGCAEAVDREGRSRALFSFIDYQTHGYHYLRAHHAPVWLGNHSDIELDEILSALVRYVANRDWRQVFIRLNVGESSLVRPVLSTLSYDQTVVVDLTGTREERLARMKPRGRQDISKGLRKSGATFADETNCAASSFDEYYSIMVETSSRDGFTSYPASYYQRMVTMLGPECCRVYAARIEGVLVAWAIVTFCGSLATYYYGATSAAVRKNHANDALFSFIFDEAVTRGVTRLDMMGIGSDFQPALLGLNQFKTKFSKSIMTVDPDRDVPVKRFFYGMLSHLRDVRDVHRAHIASRNQVSRTDLLPVILGGDISVYAYGREFHEAFGVTSIAVNPAFVAAVKRSAIFNLVPIPSTGADDLLAAVSRIAEENPSKRVPVIPSTDALVETLSEIVDRLPANVVCPIPSRDALRQCLDKERFAAACEACGLPTPATEVVHLGEDGPVAPVSIAFPLVAKPARTSEYAYCYRLGFAKVYSISSQAELDRLWEHLRSVGFTGDFLVQELIGGDDSHMGAFTFYVDRAGCMRAFGAAQTLLEDHSPTMRGNSVAMITRDLPEVREKCNALISKLGYTGFGEIDAKLNSHTGEWVFFELNPRAGRNSYYLVAGGVNPMRVMVEDLVDGRRGKLAVAADPALYTLVPKGLIYRYIADRALLSEIRDLVSKGRIFDPQRYSRDCSPLRMAEVLITEYNQLRKFAHYYPSRTDTSF